MLSENLYMLQLIEIIEIHFTKNPDFPNFSRKTVTDTQTYMVNISYFVKISFHTQHSKLI
jgi:hypothetical protein